MAFCAVISRLTNTGDDVLTTVECAADEVLIGCRCADWDYCDGAFSAKPRKCEVYNRGNQRFGSAAVAQCAKGLSEDGAVVVMEPLNGEFNMFIISPDSDRVST